MEETNKTDQPQKQNFISSSSDSDDQEAKELMDLFNYVTGNDNSKQNEEKTPEKEPKTEEKPVEEVNEQEDKSSDEENSYDDEKTNEIQEENEEIKEDQPQEEEKTDDKEPEKTTKTLGNAYLADKLMEKLRYRPKKEIVLHADFGDKTDAELVVVPPKNKQRKMFRKMMIERGNRAIVEENMEYSSDEIMDENDEDEEEEEDKKEEGNEELNEISKAIVEKLDIDKEENKELDEEDLEKKIYQQVADLRLAIDLEEIKKIIKIITGEWRSGTLRSEAAGAEAIDGAFNGDQKERKELEEKRTMRRQRKQQKVQKIERLTAQSLEELIQKAIYIQKAQDENATEADKLRGQAAMLGDNNPDAEILEKLEMEEFLKSKRVREVQEMRREKRATRKVMDKKIDFSQHIFSLKSADAKKNKASFSFVPAERNAQPSVRFPEKVVNLPVTKPSKKLLNFISRSNSSAGEDLTTNEK